MSISETLQISGNKKNQTLELLFTGKLTMENVSALWNKSFAACHGEHYKKVIIDVGHVTKCDSAGASLLVELAATQKAAGCETEYQGLSKSLAALIKAMESNEEIIATDPESTRSFAENVGYYAVGLVNQIYHTIAFTGELFIRIIAACIKPSLIRWKDVWRVMEESGPNGLPIVALLGFLVGLILSFQSIVQLQKFGAAIYVVNMVGIGLTRELAPLLTGVIVAGRTASAFAAEIGTMRVNQEVDALKTFGLSPLVFLILPRVIAVTLMTPLLSMFMIFFGLVGCAVFMSSNGYPLSLFLQQLYGAVDLSDFWGGFIKAVIFGLLIAAIGCLNGIKTTMGASAVGHSTTRAVVNSIIMLVVVDGVFSLIYYLLGV